MSKFKGLPDVALNAIRGGWKDLVHAMGGVDRTSRVVHVGISQISTYSSPHGDSLPSLATVYLAEKDTGLPYITTALAAAAGYHLVPNEPMGEGELAELLCRVGGEVGEVFSTYGAALASDGAIDAAERAAIRRKLGDAKRAILAAIAHCDAPPQPVDPQPAQTGVAA